MNNAIHQHDYESTPYKIDQETYLSDPAKAIEQLDNWLSLGHGLASAFKLLKVEEGFELTIPDYEQNGTYWLLGDKPAKTRAGALQRLGAALDAINEPDAVAAPKNHSASSESSVQASLTLASQKTAYRSHEP